MADPFGDEDTDFDLEPILTGTYTNAVAMLGDTRTALGEKIPPTFSNPLRNPKGAPSPPAIKQELSEKSKLLEDKV